MHLTTWVARWWAQMPPQAQQEFMQIVTPHSFVEAAESGLSEGAIQTKAVLTASTEFRAPLWRNNNGAAMMINPKTPDEPPRHVRFGLGNVSKKINNSWKSSDLIGITPVFVTPELLGATLGVFTAVEMKKPGWTLRTGDQRAQAQNNFMTGVQSFGGLAGFAQSVDDVRRILKGYTK